MEAAYPIPGIVVQRALIAKCYGLIDPTENDLAANDAPRCTTLGGRRQLIVKPVLLPGSHHGPASIIGDSVDIVCIPVQICYRAVVLPGVKHDQVCQIAELERAPDSQVIVHLDLSNWHPLKISTDTVHFALVNRDAAVFDKRIFSVVQLRRTVPIGIVCNLVVVPNWDPRKPLVAREEVEVSPVGGETLPVVVKAVYLLVGEWHSAYSLAIAVVTVLVLINVVAQKDHVVDRVFANHIAVGVEEAKGEVRTRVDGDSDFSHVIILFRCGFCPPQWAFIVRTTHVKLVKIRREWLQILSFNLVRTQCDLATIISTVAVPIRLTLTV